MRLHIPALGLGALFLALGLPACGGDSSGGFQAPRETASNTNLSGAGADRFTMPPMGTGANGMVSAAQGVALEWDTPAGWTQLPAKEMRAASFRLPGNDKAECYLVLLGGDSGGLASNIDRWRAQISLPPFPPAELATLQHVPLLGRDGVVVDFAGTWKGMNGTENDSGWRLTGVLQVDAAGSAFLKMTGPDALVAAEKEHFLALAKSIRPSHAGFSGAAQPAPAPAPVPAAPVAGQPPPMSPTDPAVASMAADQQGLIWMAPGAWTKAADNKMRTVTYTTPTGAECYVTRIGGDAGGLGANINRWRTQMGNTGLSAEELEKLEHLSMLGADGRMVAIEGSGDHASEAMLGAMVLVEGRATFVKMKGPKDGVAKELENFKAFAQSLKEAK